MQGCIINRTDPSLSCADVVFSPSTLNGLSEEVLRAHVALVLNSLAAEQHPKIPKFAPFVTASVLMRLHNLVADAKRNENCLGWTKQALLARVVGCFTGITIKRSDAEYIGNAQDYYLRDYQRRLAKALKEGSAHRPQQSAFPSNRSGCTLL